LLFLLIAARRVFQRPQGQAFEQHAQAGDHVDREQGGGHQRQAQHGHAAESDEGAQHEEGALGEVDEVGNAEDEGEAQRDQGIDLADGQAVEDLAGKEF
jgi:hypothetical protein